MGLRRPLIALPLDVEVRFTPQQQRLALLHELTHLKRRDLHVSALAELACALHWFNPFLRGVLPVLQADQEAACDEAVRAGGAAAPDYAGALLAAAKGPSVPALTLNHALFERIDAMRRPLPPRALRFAGGACVLALAVGAATAAQQSAEPDPRPFEEAEPAPSPEPMRERDGFTLNVTKGDGHRWAFWGDDGDGLVLLGDPFALLTAAMPTPPSPPAEAMPPLPPVPPGATFEAQMEAWGEQMGSWGERFGEGMEGYGDAMGEWGDRMGTVGDAVAELAERCEDHQARSDRPTVLTGRANGEAITAVCASGGAERLASDELRRFVDRSRELTEEERASFASAVAGGSPRIATLRATQGDDDGERSPAQADLPRFTQVAASGGTSVTLREGRDYRIELDRDAQRRTVYEVDGETLKITCRKTGIMRSCGRGDRGEVTVTMPSVASLDASSGARIVVEGGKPEGDALSVDASSGASIGFERGFARVGTLSVDASSGASIDASEVEGREVDAEASSGASVSVKAMQALDADASSGASIRYSGEPRELRTDTSSGASVRKR